MEDNTSAKTVIAEDIEIVGSIKCASNIQLDGKLNGDLACAGNAIVGNTANIKGNIAVNCATVYGQINGNITAKDKIELKSSAHVSGDIRAKRMTVEDGVTFVGKSEVNPSGGSGSPRGFSAEMKSSLHEIAPAGGIEPEPEDANVSALKEEIRKNVKEEVKGKAPSFFGKR
jgi:cytoskeletal protein CcmA (bactofilin family)